MKTLLIDNYDSFTYNLFQLLGEVNGEQPLVVRNDAASWDELAGLAVDNIVVSPGPGRPDDPADFGVCAELIRRAEVPLLGVCLGHQGVCWALGGRIRHAPTAVHGHVHAVRHDGSELFAGIPAELAAVRYHSLCVDPDLPAGLAATAWSADGVLMAVAHRDRPLWGVQFHPESVATEHGHRLLANFRDLTATRSSARPNPQPPTPPSSPTRADTGRNAAAIGPRDGLAATWADTGRNVAGIGPRLDGGGEGGLRLLVERVEVGCGAEEAFAAVWGRSENAFWLDSALAGEGGGRFSFMGDDEGPLAELVTYDVGDRVVRVERADGARETHSEGIFEYLASATARLRRRLGQGSADLPFEFDCGFVGYLGYELKADCGGRREHDAELPDAALILADRLLALDHTSGEAHLLCLTDAEHADAGERWIADVTALLEATTPGATAPQGAPGDDRSGPAALVDGVDPAAPTTAGPAAATRRGRERYLEDIAECRRLLRDGETYEVCLTDQIEAALPAGADPLDLYRTLRAVNPAPFAAYLRLGDTAVLSSSPERFLRVGRDGSAEAKPIKGTAPRGLTAAEDAERAERLRTSAKDRAENLMICDLLRNDLGRVCEIGTVEVPHLMAVESYATVHQLVSTVRGTLRPGMTAPDAVRACFPPGSMTGAPKLRTMEIVDRLEGGPRGVYSGAIGYFGISGGADLSVTIRTIVASGGRATIGVGGAIVAESDSDAEYAEALLKGAAPLAAIGELAAAGRRAATI